MIPRKKEDILLKSAFEEFFKLIVNFDKEIEYIIGKESPMGIIEAIKHITKEETAEQVDNQVRNEIVEKMVKTHKFSDTEISKITNVKLSLVKKIRSEIENL